MARFLQLHFLTSYPPANLNRDDTGRPKTAVMGGVMRLRVSSQSLKRAWRTSEVFAGAVGIDSTGVRTGALPWRAYNMLIGAKVEPAPLADLPKLDEAKAKGFAEKIHAALTAAYATGKGGDDKGGKEEDNEVMDNKEDTAGAPKAKKKDEGLKKALTTSVLLYMSHAGLARFDRMVAEFVEAGGKDASPFTTLLEADPTATDIALFGRMLANKPESNVEATCQVAHAITVHKAQIEDDWFTAVDDLNTDAETGAGHIGEVGFAAGLFYGYICIDLPQLVKNLNGNIDLARKAVEGLIRAAATVSPTGKQNTFASRARAGYMMAEAGDAQPRTLAVAFLEPIAKEGDWAKAAVERLEDTCNGFDAIYGDAPSRRHFCLTRKEGKIEDIVNFAVNAISAA